MRPEYFELFGRQRRDVDRLPNRAVYQELCHLMRDINRDLDLRFVGGGAEMRRCDHRVELQQRMVGGRRLLDEYVQRGTCYLAGFERIGERGFIDDAAARAVDDSNSLLHLRECGGADNSSRIVRQRGVNGDEVRARKKLVEADQLDADASRSLRCQDRIVSDHFHLQPDRAVGNDPADVTKADHAERLVAYLGACEFGAIPFSSVDRGVGGRNMPRQRHHHRDRMLRSCDAVAGRAVHYDDAAACRRFDIDVVDSDARAPDHFERRGRVDYFASDAGAAANQQRVVGLNYFRQLFRLEPRLDVKL